MRNKKVEIIAASVGIGGPSPEAADGPEALIESGLVERIKNLGCEVSKPNILKAGPAQGEPLDSNCRFVELLAPYLSKLYEATKTALSRGSLPLIIGGDHSLSIGSVKAVADHVREEIGADATLGLLWVDAHPDLNNPKRSPSGNIHGMSVATLLGDGHPSLTGIGSGAPALKAEHIAFVGLRDVDPEERLFIRQSNFYAATMKDVDYKGIGQVCDEALEVVNQADAFVVSFDLDVIDPRFAPAVATPVRGGLNFRESHLVLEMIAEQEKLKAIEVVEFNPSLDKIDSTCEVALDLIESSLGKSIL